MPKYDAGMHMASFCGRCGWKCLGGLNLVIVRHPYVIAIARYYRIVPAGGGRYKILSTVPTVDWVLLGFGESIKG